MPVQLDMADIKPSIMSFFVVGLMAILFIGLAKALARRFPVPGLSDWVNAV